MSFSSLAVSCCAAGRGACFCWNAGICVSRAFASSLNRNSIGPTIRESDWDCYFADFCIFWTQVVCLTIDSSTLLSWDRTWLAFVLNHWLIPPAEEILLRKAVESHLLLCLKLLLVVLVTINLWATSAAAAWAEDANCWTESKIRKRSRTPQQKSRVCFR